MEPFKIFQLVLSLLMMIMTMVIMIEVKLLISEHSPDKMHRPIDWGPLEFIIFNTVFSVATLLLQLICNVTGFKCLSEFTSRSRFNFIYFLLYSVGHVVTMSVSAWFASRMRLLCYVASRCILFNMAIGIVGISLFATITSVIYCLVVHKKISNEAPWFSINV